MFKVINNSKYMVEIIIDNKKRFIKPNDHIIVKNIDDIYTNFKDFLEIEKYEDVIVPINNMSGEGENNVDVDIDLENMKYNELKHLAKEHNISFAKNIKKDELIKLLKEKL